jgi:hypothetical protein
MSPSNGTATKNGQAAEPLPLTPSGNGEVRDPKSGQFAKGNPGGPGNPTFRKLAAARRVLLEAVTDDDLRELAQSLLHRAIKERDNEAAKLLLAYRVGKPSEVVNPDRADLDELERLLSDPNESELLQAGSLAIPAAQAVAAILLCRGLLRSEDTMALLQKVLKDHGQGSCETQRKNINEVRKQKG